MSGKSAGQMAYEAFVTWRMERDPMMFVADWTHPTVEAARGGWEAAAAAVETEQLREIRADRDQLKKRILDLASAWEDAAVTDAARVRPTQLSETRAHTSSRCAADLRKELDV